MHWVSLVCQHSIVCNRLVIIIFGGIYWLHFTVSRPSSCFSAKHPRSGHFRGQTRQPWRLQVPDLGTFGLAEMVSVNMAHGMLTPKKSKSLSFPVEPAPQVED